MRVAGGISGTVKALVVTRTALSATVDLILATGDETLRAALLKILAQARDLQEDPLFQPVLEE